MLFYLLPIYQVILSAGNVSSTFTGSAVDSGSTGNGYSIEHTYTTRDTSENGNHYHTISHTMIPNSSNTAWTPIGTNYGGAKEFTDDAGSHTHTVRDYYANRISGVEAHKHSVTAKGTVSSTFTGSSTTTNTVGNGQAFSVRDPYITVYMWKRIS